MTIPLHDDSILARYSRPAAVTAYVPLPDASEDADQHFDLAVSAARDKIEELVDAGTAAAVDKALRSQGYHVGRTLVAVADDAETVQVWPSSMEMPSDVTEGPLPNLGRLMAASQAWIPHTVAVVDRAGADIRVVRPAGVVKDSSVEGDDLHITKSQPGGWSQKRFQRSAEEQWENNASLIADEIATSLDPDELLLVAGDETMRPILIDALPDSVTDRVVQMEVGTRADDGSDADLGAALHEAVSREAFKRHAEMQADVMNAVGRGDGVAGRDEVTKALFQGLADVLVLHVDTAAALTAHVGEEPNAVSADATTLHQLDMNATQVSLSDAVLRAAAATGCDVVVARDGAEDLADGVAVKLRS